MCWFVQHPTQQQQRPFPSRQTCAPLQEESRQDRRSTLIGPVFRLSSHVTIHPEKGSLLRTLIILLVNGISLLISVTTAASAACSLNCVLIRGGWGGWGCHCNHFCSRVPATCFNFALHCHRYADKLSRKRLISRATPSIRASEGRQRGPCQNLLRTVHLPSSFR